MPETLYHCPHCNAECTAAKTSGPGRDDPAQGDFASCVGCHSLLIATTDDFRLGTRKDVERLTPQRRQEIESVMGEIVFAPGG